MFPSISSKSVHDKVTWYWDHRWNSTALIWVRKQHKNELLILQEIWQICFARRTNHIATSLKQVPGSVLVLTSTNTLSMLCLHRSKKLAQPAWKISHTTARFSNYEWDWIYIMISAASWVWSIIKNIIVFPSDSKFLNKHLRDCFLKAIMSSPQEQEQKNIQGAVKMWPEDFNPVCPWN